MSMEVAGGKAAIGLARKTYVQPNHVMIVSTRLS